MNLRIVHVVAHPFLPPEDGGRLKTLSLATALARCGEVHWVSLDDHHRAKAPDEPAQALDLPWGGTGIWHSTVGVPCKRCCPRSPLGWLRAARAGVRLPLAWLPLTQRHGEVIARISSLKPDLVVADETALAPFAAFAPARWRIIHAHNHDSRMLTQAVFEGSDRAHQARSAKRLEQMERVLFPSVDQVWGVRRGDLDAFEGFGVARRKLFTAPNIVPDNCFEGMPEPGTPGQALFFGSLWYPPNRQAVDWLLDLWPEVRRRMPEARLTIAGRGATPALEARAAQTEGVALLGFVPDLKRLLRESALVVIPISSGGGTKIKTIEAMAAGVPILATPEAAEGLGLEEGVHAVIRAPGAAFLDMAIAMLRSPEQWQGMGVRAREKARTDFSLAALQAAVDFALGRLYSREPEKLASASLDANQWDLSRRLRT